MKLEFLFLIALVVFTSCRKEKFLNVQDQYNSITKADVERDFTNFMRDDVDGAITIHGSHWFNSAEQNATLAIYANFQADSIKSLTFGEIKVHDSNAFHYSNVNQDPDIFGSILNFNISAEYPEVNIYVPERIYGGYDYDTLASGNLVTWNADPLNDIGILVVVTYDPVMAFPPEEGNVIYSYALTEDDGSYVLPASLFKDIPAGKMVSFTLYRGNYQRIISNDETRVVNFVAYSQAVTRLYTK